jgi:dTDP-glucose pyrophosphorylase
MKLVLTMAGKYERFKLFGNKVPKYLMPLGANTILWHVLYELKRVAPDTEFFLIANKDDRDFFPVVTAILKNFSIPQENLEYVSNTKSQLATAVCAEKAFNNRLIQSKEPIVFGNIDTVIKGRRSFFDRLENIKEDQGLIDSFVGSSHSYSYLKSNKNGIVEMISDGARLSNKACSGLYAFGSGISFFRYAKTFLNTKEDANFTELYRELISNDMVVYVCHNDDSRDTIVLGTPEEYTVNIHRF